MCTVHWRQARSIEIQQQQHDKVTTTKKKIEEEEEYGGLKVLHECKFKVGNQLPKPKRKKNIRDSMNVDNMRTKSQSS